jgi:hypothetical protein
MMRHVTPHVKVESAANGGGVQLFARYGTTENMVSLKPDEVTALLLALIAEQRAGFMLARYEELCPELLNMLEDAEGALKPLHHELTEMAVTLRVLRSGRLMATELPK